MFELIPSHTKIPFMKFKIPMICFSLFMTGSALYFIATKGFNYGVDFSGGVQMVLSLPSSSSVDAEALRKNLENIGIENASVQTYGTQFEAKPHEFIVHFPAEFLSEQIVRPKIESALKASRTADLKADESLVRSFKFVGLEKAYLTLARPIGVDQVKKALESVSFGMARLLDVSIFGRGTQNEFQLSFASIGNIVTTELSKKFGGNEEVKALKVDFVGAKVGGDLRTSALLSLIIMAALIFVYIFVRFDLVYAPGVVLSLIHDVLITAGFFALSGREFDLTIVAALLTLAGYSINDTIIVYDRIREVSHTMKGKSFSDIIDLAVNQTLARTIITSGTVFLATLALWVYGGPVIHGFSYAFLIGVIVGTYSSVFVAAPTILLSQRFFEGRQTRSGRAAAA